MKLFVVDTKKFEYDTFDSAVIACDSREKLQEMLDDGVFDSYIDTDSDVVENRTNSGFQLVHKVEEITEIGIYTLPTDKQAVVVLASFNAG